MARTIRQQLGDFGEKLVGRSPCPKCKRENTLKQLPINFACADIICNFCGFLAQVKSAEKENVDVLPKYLLGAAWAPQKEHMDAGIYFPLFIVVVSPDRKKKPSIICRQTFKALRCLSPENRSHLLQNVQDGKALQFGWMVKKAINQYV